MTKKILGKLLDEFKDEDIKILICPDHPTPLELRTHTNAPVPFMIYDSRKKLDGVDCFCEESAAKTGDYIAEGHTLMSSFWLTDNIIRIFYRPVFFTGRFVIKRSAVNQRWFTVLYRFIQL